jgi:nicotinamidase-related amidase
MPQNMNDYISPHRDRSALITIDMQRDFALPGAPAEVAGTAQVIPAIQQVVSAFRKHGLPVIHVVRLYLPDGSNSDLCRRDPISSGKTIVAPGSMGAELVEELKPSPGTKLDSSILLSGGLQALGNNEWVIYKPRWGAFYSTNLENHLRRVEADTLVITGCNFPNCPRTTIYEASERDFRLILVTDAVSGLYEQGAKELANIGVCLMTSNQLTNWYSNNAA